MEFQLDLCKQKHSNRWRCYLIDALNRHMHPILPFFQPLLIPLKYESVLFPITYFIKHIINKENTFRILQQHRRNTAKRQMMRVMYSNKPQRALLYSITPLSRLHNQKNSHLQRHYLKEKIIKFFKLKQEKIMNVQFMLFMLILDCCWPSCGVLFRLVCGVSLFLWHPVHLL